MLEILQEVSRGFDHTMIQVTLSLVMICTQVSPTKHGVKLVINEVVFKVVLNVAPLLLLVL